MTPEASAPAPRLAPPGAGLPAPELLIARLLFRLHRWRHDRVKSAALFASDRDEILRLARSLPLQQATRPVLIRRLPGLEDSSRNWSVLMVVEHLRLVNHGVFGAIRSLCAGEVPAVAASTATVKPAAGIGIEVLAAFEADCRDNLRQVGLLRDLRTPLRYAHPWFGPLNADAWFAMAGFHQRLHRRQIETIIRTAAFAPSTKEVR